MRVLLINSNLKDDILAAPPIGLCYVASAAEVAGHEVRVLDLCFKRRLSCYDPKLITSLINFPYPGHICNFPLSIDKSNSWQVTMMQRRALLVLSVDGILGFQASLTTSR